MKWWLILFMLLGGGCATQYILPTNRFMTPESQGGMFNSRFEMQQTTGNQLTADLSNSSVEDGVTQTLISRTGYQFSSSIFDSLDFFWSHVGGANSMMGAKYQFLGPPRVGNGTGNKMAIAVGFGGNQHKIEGDTQVEFELNATEYQLLYGYRFSDLILVYSNFSYAKYVFEGKVISTDAALNGLEPTYNTKAMGLYGGLEIDLGPFFGKVECGYQQLKTDYTSNISQFIYGFGAGFNW